MIAIRGNPTFMTFSGDELLLNNGNSMEYNMGCANTDLINMKY